MEDEEEEEEMEEEEEEMEEEEEAEIGDELTMDAQKVNRIKTVIREVPVDNDHEDDSRMLEDNKPS